MIKNVLYFGELGFFMHILGAIEYYLTKYADVELSICTYKTYYDILKILFGNRIHLWDIVPLATGPYGSKREKHLSKYYEINNYLQLSKIIKHKERLSESYHLLELLKHDNVIRGKDLECVYKDRPFSRFSSAVRPPNSEINDEWLKISKPIIYKNEYLENKYKNKNIILFFCRKKCSGSKRNFKQHVKKYINKTMSYFNKLTDKLYEPVQWGVESSLCPEFPTISDIKEFIYVCNNCHLFISCDSGLIDLALHANVKQYCIIQKKNYIQPLHSNHPHRCLFNYKLFDSKEIEEELFHEDPHANP